MAADSPMELARTTLQEVWGFELRGLQHAVIARLLESEASAALIMPTGGGKSLCFQVGVLSTVCSAAPHAVAAARSVFTWPDPGGALACLSSGQAETAQVSPLIALMKVRSSASRCFGKAETRQDQVDGLRKRGVKAAAMDSSQSMEVRSSSPSRL